MPTTRGVQSACSRRYSPDPATELVCGGVIALCQHPESTAYFEEYQLILVIPLVNSEELPWSVSSRDSLFAGQRAPIPLSCISGNIIAKKDNASGVPAGKSVESFPGQATSHVHVFTWQ
jgi:hypothetical protein